MDGAGIWISALGLTGLVLTIYIIVIAAALSAGLIVSSRIKSPCEDEADELADGDMPHLAPDVLTSFHAQGDTP